MRPSTRVSRCSRRIHMAAIAPSAMMSSMHVRGSNTFALSKGCVFFPGARAGVAEHARAEKPEERVGKGDRGFSDGREYHVVCDENPQHHVDEAGSCPACKLVSGRGIRADVGRGRFGLACERVLCFAFEFDLRDFYRSLVFVDGRLEFGFLFRAEFERADNVLEELSDSAANNLVE